ncbi:hypothetical protein [Flavihumibacter profundi]|uniref:hypothetical protein n=1 Tax=Flavihumibacter profundi TaxID=2716883 RepID=UPI001CC347F6|nr:hypothetical protein [Flavihumibacter profundi]MBZ5858170.1 hypothetical protein [Flavihumibacter profundi]
MPDKKHNNPAGWQSRLEQLGQLPGEPSYNKGAAWGKLYAKLEQPKRKNNKIWLWMAAAAIFTALLITIPWFKKEYNNQDQPVAKTRTGAEPLVTRELAIVPEGHPEPAAKGINKLVLTKRASSGNHQASGAKKPNTPIEQMELTPAISSIRITQQPFAANDNKMDSPLLSVAPIARQKKKMAVVYLNEIEAGGNNLITNQAHEKPHRTFYPNFGQTGADDIYAASKPERFTINISSAN